MSEELTNVRIYKLNSSKRENDVRYAVCLQLNRDGSYLKINVLS